MAATHLFLNLPLVHKTSHLASVMFGRGSLCCRLGSGTLTWGVVIFALPNFLFLAGLVGLEADFREDWEEWALTGLTCGIWV